MVVVESLADDALNTAAMKKLHDLTVKLRIKIPAKASCLLLDLSNATDSKESHAKSQNELDTNFERSCLVKTRDIDGTRLAGLKEAATFIAFQVEVLHEGTDQLQMRW